MSEGGTSKSQVKPAKPSAATPPRRHKTTPRIGEQRREALLDSAESLLKDSSATDLTIENIAVAASLSRSSVYFYFESKSAIVDALIVRASDEMLERTGPRSRAETLDVFLNRIVGAALEGWRKHRVVFLAAAEFASHANDGTTRWRAIMMVFADRVSEAYLQDRADGPDSENITEANLIGEMICWMIERNYYMLFARKHDKHEETVLMNALTRSAIATCQDFARTIA